MKYYMLTAALLGIMELSAKTTLTISVTNPLSTNRTDQPVVIPLAGKGVVRSALVMFKGQEMPCQLDDLDQDDDFDELCFLTNLEANETRSFEITLSEQGEPRHYEPRVYAEMLMRNDKVKEKNRHNNYIESLTARGDCANSYNLQHHHGVSFESELNGIRIYFDKRQTLDLYGKFHKRLELMETQFYTSDSQKKEGYGDDVLWVGQTFGLGAFRGWNGKESTMIEPVRSRTQRVISYGPLRTIVEIVDRGWLADEAKPPVNMTLRYTQYAGHRDTDIDVFFDHDVSDYQFSTGIIDIKGSEEFTDGHGLRGCWGTDYPATDTVKWSRETLGLAIFVPQPNVISEIPASKDRTKQGGDYTYVVKVQNNHMSYKVCYTSANEDFGFQTSNQWFDWLRKWKKEVKNPVIVK